MRTNNRQDWFLNRRKMLALLGATGMHMVGGYSSASSGGGERLQRTLSCIITPEQTEGPYFVDERLNRSDIRSDPSNGSIKEGLPLALEIRVFAASKTECKPVSDAFVDVWHCDGGGVYSDVIDSSFKTVGQKFLRGYQVTDANGSVRFITIYPGWYPGRTVHIHFKIRTKAKYTRVHEFTSQFYFNDAITDLVHAQQPYAGKAPSRVRRTRNEGDGIFRKGGDKLMLALAETGQGYAATFDVGLQGISE
ncbi:MAG: intradiol ring-cleavage dioxygenase [Nitrosospira sp.]|nr:intradiol ring-cleavage dioxygenase [Nitrosospira sp.]